MKNIVMLNTDDEPRYQKLICILKQFDIEVVTSNNVEPGKLYAEGDRVCELFKQAGLTEL